MSVLYPVVILLYIQFKTPDACTQGKTQLTIVKVAYVSINNHIWGCLSTTVKHPREKFLSILSTVIKLRDETHTSAMA